MDGLTDIKIYVFVLDFYTVDLNIEWNVNSFAKHNTDIRYAST